MLPVDPNYPAERVEHMVSDAQVALGITTAELRGALPATLDWLELGPDGLTATGDPGDEFVASPSVDDLAYVIFTSGRPAVRRCRRAPPGCRRHRRRAALALRRRARVARAALRVAQFRRVDLRDPARRVRRRDPDRRHPRMFGGDELARLLQDERVTHAFVTPAALSTVPVTGLDDLRSVFVAGDVCPPELVRRWAVPRADGTVRRMYNLYGPSEATIWSTATDELIPGGPLTIGGPVTGVRLAVLDDRLNPVPRACPVSSTSPVTSSRAAT